MTQPPCTMKSAAIGSLAQSVVDQGIPAVLGMRYSVFVVTAAQYIGELYAALAKGREFGQAASEARKHLHSNPERWVNLQARPLQDWFVPVVYEAAPIRLLPADTPFALGTQQEMDPVQNDATLRRYVPDSGFVGRDETLLMLDRAFDDHPIVLLHAYAGQGKTATAVEFARWYALTRGLGRQPVVLFTSFEFHTDLTKVLDQVGQFFSGVLRANGIEWHRCQRTRGAAQPRHPTAPAKTRAVDLGQCGADRGISPTGVESAWTAAEQAELSDFLKQVKLDHATKVKILLTSRRDEHKWLGGIRHRVPMPEMSLPDAASLALKLGADKGLTRDTDRQLVSATQVLRGESLHAPCHRRSGREDGPEGQGADRGIRPGFARRRAARSKMSTRPRAATNPSPRRWTTGSATHSRKTNCPSSRCSTCSRAQ